MSKSITSFVPSSDPIESDPSRKPLGELMTLTDAIEDVTGKRLGLASVRRWYRKGVAGVKLQVLFLDGRFWTTPLWVTEFIDRSTAAKIERYSDRPKLSIEQEPQVKSAAVTAAVKKFHSMKPKGKGGARRKADSEVGN